MTRREFHRTIPAALRGPGPRTAASAEDGRTLLLVDDHHVLYRPGTRRILHPLTRSPKNPVLAGGVKPWEVAVGWHSVHRDLQTGLYQLWYQAFSGRMARQKTHRCVVCYAESRDGQEWTRPNLGIHNYNDIQETNIVLIGNGGHSVNYGASVLFDPRDPDPKRRYKMAYFDWSFDGGREYPGLSVAFSPDGVHWSKFPHAPLLRASYGNHGELVPYRDETSARPWSVHLAISDAMDAIWDPRAGAYAIYHKMWIDTPDGRMYWKHAMGRTESKDFVHWSHPRLLLTCDELDPSWVEFHHSPVFYYAGYYFGLLQILNRAERGGIMDIELALSHDGLHWQRPFRHPFFLARSKERSFDSGTLLVSPTPVLLEDEFRFYYGGMSEGATGGDDYSMISGIGLATMQRDRFAGVRPTEGVAQITFQPLELGPGSAMTINADAAAGAVEPELLDENGRRIRGFASEDALPVTGDGLRCPVRWRGRQTGELPRGRYLLRLHLKNAEVFAITVSGSPAAP
jgi:hypothetical protein